MKRGIDLQISDMRLKNGLAAIALLVATSCGGGREHYYAMCDGRDARGWLLTNTEYDDGYLIACTYTRPDGRDWYEVRCRSV